MDQQQQTRTSGSTSNTGQQRSDTNLKDFILADKISFVLCLSRLFTILCSFIFIIPIASTSSYSLYQKALLSNAVTSALKLHQRLAGIRFEFSRAFIQSIFIEDSCHYLFYSIIFLNSYPITIVLAPCVLFAIVHVASYIKALTNVVANGRLAAVIRKATNLIITKDKDLMKFAAMNEILLMPIVIFMLFTGKGALFTPFIYYRFICLRYQSRRNPYNKQMFTELRMTSEFLLTHPKCPQFIRPLVTQVISFISRLAPVQ